jgi:hypothetical protein
MKLTAVSIIIVQRGAGETMFKVCACTCVTVSTYMHCGGLKCF